MRLNCDIPVKEIDLSIPERKVTVSKVPFQSSRNKIWTNNNGPIRLFMIVSRLLVDHAVYYVFITGDNDIDSVESFVKSNGNVFGHDLVLIDTGEAVNNREGAEKRGVAIKDAFKNANVILPALILGKKED